MSFSKLKHLNFQKRIFISFLVLNIFSIILITGLFFLQIKKSNKVNVEANVKENLAQVQQNMSIKIQTVNTSLSNLSFNENLRTFFLTAHHPTTSTSMYQYYLSFRDTFDPAVDSVLSNNGYIKEVTFFTNSPLHQYRKNIIDINSKENPSFIINYVPSNKPTWIFSENEIYIISHFPTYSENKDIIQFTLDKRKFFENIHFLSPNYNLIVTQDKEVIYRTTDKLGKSDQLFKTISMDLNDWTLKFYINNAEYHQSILNAMKLNGFILGCFILLSLVGSYFLSKQIITPVNELKEKISKVPNENLNVSFKTDATDEIATLSNFIDSLLKRIQLLIKDNYEKTIEKQNSDYKALTNQINSHFLYNTLSTMSWKALLSDQEDLSQAIQTLSKYYRTTLNHGKSHISLEEEIENAKTYIELQQFLNPKRFEITYDIDESLNHATVINLLIQPIIENAIEHGFQNKLSDAKLSLSVKRVDENKMEIEVTDNGAGMEEEVLKNLLNKNGKGYGLKNVNLRIKFYFGEDYGLNITSTPGLGTKASILLPITFYKI